MLPFASIGAGSRGRYEVVHGCALDIAGQDYRQPARSHSVRRFDAALNFERDDFLQRIELAVRRVLASGYRTGDMFEPRTCKLGTSHVGDLAVAAMS
jgi:3-isopropylmalate dehydrogenase